MLSSGMNFLVLVIDAQWGFCDGAGSLSEAFGAGELATIQETVPRLNRFLINYPRPEEIRLVRSRYIPGQFTKDDLSHPLAHLCTSARKDDGRWSLSQAAVHGKPVITKSDESALSSQTFQSELNTLLHQGLQEVMLTGFLTTSCVSRTALDLRQALPRQVKVKVFEDLCASRSSSYLAPPGRPSRHAAALSTLLQAGIIVENSSYVEAPPNPSS
jgi:nicotinamidase-related amidase